MKRPLLATLALAGASLALLAWLWVGSDSPSGAPADPAPEQAASAGGRAEPVEAEPTTSSQASATARSTLPAVSALEALRGPPPPQDDYLRQLEALNVSDKQAALTLAEKGDEWYPDSGVRAEARRAMRITLLVDLGRMPEARALTRTFIERYPTSPYRRLVQGVTGVHPRPSGPR